MGDGLMEVDGLLISFTPVLIYVRIRSLTGCVILTEGLNLLRKSAPITDGTETYGQPRALGRRPARTGGCE